MEDHSYRIKSGLEEARRKGKQIGRPKATKIKYEDKIVGFLKDRVSIRKTATKVGVSDKTVKRVKNKRRIEIELALSKV